MKRLVITIEMKLDVLSETGNIKNILKELKREGNTPFISFLSTDEDVCSVKSRDKMKIIKIQRGARNEQRKIL